MKLLLSCSLFLLLALFTHGQTKYVFQMCDVNCPKVEKCQGDQFLSEDVQIKLEQFNLIYTKKIDIDGPRCFQSTEIDKPDLYYSVQKLSNYYRKGLKKGTIDKAEAESELKSILDKCIQIFSKDTTPIEAELRAASNPKDIVSIFDKIIIKND